MTLAYKYLKKIYRLISYSKSVLVSCIRRLFNFIIPNLKFIISGRLSFKNIPRCQQKTLLTGSGVIDIGKNCSFGYKLGGFHRGGAIEIQPRYKSSKILIGSNVSTNNNIFICAANYIEIGDNTLIGQYVTVMDHEAHGIDPEKRRLIGQIGTVKIKKNVWIGNNVTILKNSEIEENTIIAAGAVVSGKFPKNVIIGGIPAKVIKGI